MFDVSTLTEGKTYELAGRGNFKLAKFIPGRHEFRSVDDDKPFINSGAGVVREVTGGAEAPTPPPAEAPPAPPSEPSGEVVDNTDSPDAPESKKARKKRIRDEARAENGGGE